MRSTTKAIAAVAAIASSLAFGVSSASALQWSYDPQSWQPKLKGSLELEFAGTEFTATCPEVALPVNLDNSHGLARWNVYGGGPVINDCIDNEWDEASTLPIRSWYFGTTASAGGDLTMTMTSGPADWWQGPFLSSPSFTNLPSQPMVLSVANGNVTTPTTVTFDDDVIGDAAGGFGNVRASGTLTLSQPHPFVPGAGGLITLNP